MRFRQRDDEEASRREHEAVNHPAAGDNGDHGDHGDNAEAREAAERFLASADEAIDRALSGDSEAFLAASRQQGGQ